MIKILIKVVCLLIAIAYYTIAERKVMAAIQRRRGPNVVGMWGLLQPLADGLKLIVKELVIPSHANSRIFIVAPLFALALSFMNWTVIPFDCIDLSEHNDITELLRAAQFIEQSDMADTRYGILTILAISGLSVYWITLAGWSSNSKYAFLGALRSAAQMISYEVVVSLTILPVTCMAGSANLTEIVLAQHTTTWNIVPLLPAAVLFFIAMVAETNRTPFDLPEAEAELVAGYNVEYASITFAMFFLAEYGNMILSAFLFVILFLGGWICGALVLKGLVFCYLFILIRATLPRYRYDQLMNIGWKVFLPTGTGFFVFTIALIYAADAAPIGSALLFGKFLTFCTITHTTTTL